MAFVPPPPPNSFPKFLADASTIGRKHTMSLSSAVRASRLSGSTAFNSSSSLNSFSSASTMVASTNGQVIATANIINQKADASRSLFQICMSLRQRLGQVPGFEPYLEQLEQIAAQDPDPVESLWKLLRTGHPLLAVYNIFSPHEPIVLPDAGTESKRSKLAILKFVQSCTTKLGIPPGEVFIINDLVGTDTTGFVKVTTVINRVLDIADQRQLLRTVQPYPDDDVMQTGSQMSYRDYIVRELVDTERKYVQDLENLHDLKKTLQQKGVIPGDTVHRIFGNVDQILDFQRRFLIRVETTNSMPQARQEWGAPFVANEDQFNIYEPFIANQRKAAQVASQVFDRIQAAEHPVAFDFNTLDGFLLKPMQRLVKYPLLLKDLMKKSEDEATKADLQAGISAAERVLSKANEAVDRDLLDEALDGLINRVDDWKNHRVQHFGKLLLHGVYTVVTGKSEQEKDYEIFLFESILLCCKEIPPPKSRDKKDKTKSTGANARNRNTKLQLKGRIFMANVTDVLAITNRAGSYVVQVWWKGDPGVENFMIKFQNEETMRKWENILVQLQKDNDCKKATSPETTQPLDFEWTRRLAPSENPYAQQEDDDDDDDGYTPTPSVHASHAQQSPKTMPGTMQRNASNTSLRKRSATGESQPSLAGIARVAPPRFPMPLLPSALNVQTQTVCGPHPSPGPRGGDSYFSPLAESPASSRTSTTSGMFSTSAGYASGGGNGPLQAMWNAGGELNRYTAPAMPGALSRDGPSPANLYGMAPASARNPCGPSMPVMPRDPPQSQFQQQRSRSYSTPDINGQPNGGRRPFVQPSVPAVPGIPLHLANERHDCFPSRSNTGSPVPNEQPVRTATGSPGAQRTREQRGQLGATMAQFPAQPIYSRSVTPANGGHGQPPPGLAPLNPDMARSAFPPLGSAGLMNSGPDGMPMPTQLKVKVNCGSGKCNSFTLVVPLNISFATLTGRLDNKLSRFTVSSIAQGDLRLKYKDEDGDFVSIYSDEDVQMAINEWREAVARAPEAFSGPMGVGEIELFCVGEME